MSYLIEIFKEVIRKNLYSDKSVSSPKIAQECANLCKKINMDFLFWLADNVCLPYTKTDDFKYIENNGNCVILSSDEIYEKFIN